MQESEKLNVWNVTELPSSLVTMLFLSLNYSYFLFKTGELEIEPFIGVMLLLLI